MAEEIFEIVNEKEEIIGQAPRSECHRDPSLMHRAIHCWIFNSQGQVLWQQRSLTKDSHPGMWDVSCGGHVDPGEHPDATLIRELEEELGLRNVKTTYVTKYIAWGKTQTELTYLYYGLVDKPAEEFKIQEDEVQQVQWIDIAEAQRKTLDREVNATKKIFTEIGMLVQYLIEQFNRK